MPCCNVNFEWSISTELDLLTYIEMISTSTSGVCFNFKTKINMKNYLRSHVNNYY